MSNKPRLRPYPQGGSITIANGEEHRIERGGSFIRVREADQAFTILLDDDTELKAEQNDVFRFPDGPFKDLSVINDSGANLTFQLEIGQGAVETNNVSISGTLTTTVTSPSNFDSKADDSVAATTTEQILASNTSRKEAIISNLAANTQTFRVGDSGAGATNGIPLAPGETIVLSTTAAIYAYNPGASAESLAVTEV